MQVAERFRAGNHSFGRLRRRRLKPYASLLVPFRPYAVGYLPLAFSYNQKAPMDPQNLRMKMRYENSATGSRRDT